MNQRMENEICKVCSDFNGCYSHCMDICGVPLDIMGKQVSKKPVIIRGEFTDSYTCPCCCLGFISKNKEGWFAGKRYIYCPDCGQRIDWTN